METNRETQILNLSGTILEISKTTWALIKNNIPSESQDEIKVRGNDIFVERNAVAFRAILDYYLSGNLHMPTELCPSSFKLDLDFWGIEPAAMEKNVAIRNTCYSLKINKYYGYWRRMKTNDI